MPTNEQRRETAKRKLERQLPSVAPSKPGGAGLMTIIGAVVALATVVAVVLTFVLGDDDPEGSTAASFFFFFFPSSSAALASAPGQLQF